MFVSGRLQLSFFGPIQVLVDGKHLPRLRSKKSLSLLVILVLRSGQATTRRWLAATLWPDVDVSIALSSLRPLLSELKKALVSEGGRLRSVDRNTVAFDIDGLEIDVLEFDQAIKCDDFHAAIERYSGPFFEGSVEDWVFQERQARLEAFVSAVVRYGETATAAADYERAIRMYRQAIDADPFRDPLRRGLMEAHAALGNVNNALQEYREYVLLLSRERGLVPEHLTTDLYHRLRREIRRAKVHPSADPLAHSVDVAHNLPSRIDVLIGREDEQTDVAALVRENRLVTLTGVGGMGKTALAVAVADKLGKAFHDGAWFFALEFLTRETDLFWELARLLNLSSELARPARAAVEEHFRDKQVLLVLDNCEHLIENAAKFSEQVLQRCEKLHILATSRKALGSQGEAVWSVPPLGYPTPPTLPEGRTARLRVASDYDGVRLFVQRAKAVRAEFALDQENIRSVVDICAKLEGNPLGIELAAARVCSMSASSLAESLQTHSLRILKARNRRSSERQSSARATLDWSFELLATEEQALFRRLSVFNGGWSLDAAEHVVSGDGIEKWRVAELLDSLIDHSLVIYDTDLNRFRFLETVRQYSEEKLSQSREQDSLLRNLRHWSEGFVRSHEMLTVGSAYSESLIPIRQEMPNIRIALDSCADDPLVGLSIVSKLRRYFGYDGLIAPGLALFEAALQRDVSGLATCERADSLLGVGILALQASEFERAKTSLNQALQMHERLGLLSGQAEALDELANVEFSLGRYAAVQEYCEKAVGIVRRIGNKAQLAKAIQTYSGVLADGTNPDLLRDASKEAIRLQRELGGTISIAWPLRDLALYERWVGNWDAARELIKEGLSLLAGSEDLNSLAVMHEFAGKFAYEMYDLAGAEFHYELSARTHEQANYSHWAFRAKWQMAAVRIEQGRLEEAERIIKNLSPHIPSDQAILAVTEEDLGVLALKRQDWSKSRAHFKNGLQASLKTHYLRAIPILLERLSVLSHLEADLVGAARYLGASNEARARIRLVRTPFRSNLIDPVQMDCLQSLGYERFWAVLQAGREMDLNSLVE